MTGLQDFIWQYHIYSQYIFLLVIPMFFLEFVQYQQVRKEISIILICIFWSKILKSVFKIKLVRASVRAWVCVRECACVRPAEQLRKANIFGKIIFLLFFFVPYLKNIRIPILCYIWTDRGFSKQNCPRIPKFCMAS
jgi:hypothetical protein